MNWIEILGLSLLLISLAILASFIPNIWTDDIGHQRPAPEQRDILEGNIREYIRRRRLRAKQWTFGFGATLLLASIFLILKSSHNNSALAPPLGPGRLAPAVVPPSATTTSITAPSVQVWDPAFFLPSFFVAGLLIFGVFLIVSRSILARFTGASLLFAATVSSQFHLIRELKLEIAPKVNLGSQSATAAQIEQIVDRRIAALRVSLFDELKSALRTELHADLYATLHSELHAKLSAEIKSLVDKIEINIDDIKLTAKLEAKFNTYLRQIGTLGPEHLGDFVGFERGSSAFAANMDKSALDVCDRWRDRSHNKEGLLLVIGATDRIPLGPAGRLRYESNFGLARARAEQVKSKIVECGIPATRILAIVSGPRTTPERKNRPSVDSGYPEDRMVDVWVVWSWRDSP